jgi:hypothetical protein
MTSIESLIAVFDAYAASSRQAEATVATKFLGRGNRMSELRAGGDMGARTIARALQAFSNHWPEGAVWPEGVERPALSSEAAE